MTAEDVKALPIDRKIQIMEAIWEDFRDRFDRLEVSPQQKDLLDRRRARVREGAAQLLDWEAVKATIGRSCISSTPWRASLPWYGR
jgi:putative addiction module component (TIGR02574 family)